MFSLPRIEAGGHLARGFDPWLGGGGRGPLRGGRGRKTKGGRGAQP